MGQFTDPSRLGLVNNSGTDTEALFLKIFSGEIVTTFEKANIMMPLHRVRTIQSGKSAIFPVTGTANAGYHTPGESVLSQGVNTTAAFANTVSSATPVNNTVAVDSSAQSSKYLNKFNRRRKYNHKRWRKHKYNRKYKHICMFGTAHKFLLTNIHICTCVPRYIDAQRCVRVQIQVQIQVPMLVQIPVQARDDWQPLGPNQCKQSILLPIVQTTVGPRQ